jgi:hypothetical protein
MAYHSEITWHIYSIEDSKNSPHPDYRLYGLVDTHKSFPNEADAIAWIEEESDRHIAYTIIKEYKKP